MLRTLFSKDDDEEVMRPLDWIFPSEAVEREVLHVAPDEPDEARPPLLFVHGASMGAWCWKTHWMPAAAECGWDCYALSLRGHGNSGGQDRRHRWLLRDYVHDVMQTIVELPRPPVLIGHSMGAAVVERVVARYPAPMAVLMAPPGDRNGLITAGQILRRRPADFFGGLLGRSIPARHEYLFSPDVDRRSTRSARTRTRPLSALNQYEVLLPNRTRHSLCPLVIVGMEEDTLVPFGAVERFAQRRSAKAIFIPRAGHTPQLEPEHWEDALHIVLNAVETTLRKLPGHQSSNARPGKPE